MDKPTPGTPAALRRSPTGRVPQWVVDEATGRQSPPAEWRSWSSPTPQPSRRRPRGRVVLVVVLIVGLGLAAVLLPRPGLPGSVLAEAAPATSRPTPGHEAADAPLGTALPPPVRGGSHAFVAHQQDSETPVAYDPCRPIHYVMRPDNAPVGGEAILHEAVDHISDVTGLQFVYDGDKGDRPSRDRKPYQPDRYGDRWAPVVIAWETEDENPTFLTEVIGEAGSQGLSIGDGPQVFVTGGVSLDEAAFDQVLAVPGGTAVARAVVLHELGHLVGLDHVSDVGQLMYPTTSAVLDLAPGDLTGLSALGRGDCEPAL